MGEPLPTARLSGGYHLDQIDRLVEALQPLIWLAAPSRIRVDLGSLANMSPACLAVLTAVINNLGHQNLIRPRSEYVAPRNFLARQWLAQMDFEQILFGSQPSESLTLPTDRARRPCTRITDAAQAGAVAVALSTAMHETCKLDEGARRAIWYALSELAQNVTQHASVGSGGIAAAHRLRNQREFELAIADCGIGIRSSLAKNSIHSALVDDLDAITKALKLGVSGIPTNPGLGLHSTATLLRENGGVLLIRSGTASVTTGGVERHRTGLPPFPGTVVAIRARIDDPLDLKPFFNRLEASRKRQLSAA